MPYKLMMRLTHRYGWKLSCGWLPPTELTEFALIAAVGAVSQYAATAGDAASW